MLEFNSCYHEGQVGFAWAIKLVTTQFWPVLVLRWWLVKRAFQILFDKGTSVWVGCGCMPGTAFPPWNIHSMLAELKSQFIPTSALPTVICPGARSEHLLCEECGIHCQKDLQRRDWQQRIYDLTPSPFPWLAFTFSNALFQTRLSLFSPLTIFLFVQCCNLTRLARWLSFFDFHCI